MSSRRQNQKLKVKCQYCKTISYTRTLDFDLICMTCGKYAKRYYQKFKQVKEFPTRGIRTSKRPVYILDSVTCENCKESVLINA